MTFLLKKIMSNSNETSVPGSVPQNSSHFFKNPYKKIKKILLNVTNLNENSTPLLSSSAERGDIMDRHDIQADDLLPWGDDIQAKQASDTRIFFQNINGFSTKNITKWSSSLEWLRNNETDIVGLAEPNVNVQNPKCVQQYLNKLKLFGTRSTGLFSNNTNPSESHYQPGGTFMMCKETWKSRIVATIQDSRQWGRFVGYTYRLKQNHFLTVITAYRVVNRLGVSLGIKTSVKHQKDLSNKAGITTSVRQTCLLDIATIIDNSNAQFGNDHFVILMIDANETIDDLTSTLPEFLLKVNLIDIIPEFHQLHGSISSQIRSRTNRRIDFIFCSPGLKHFISKCGYLPFDRALESDHRGIYMDLNLNNLKDLSEHSSAKRMIGSHEPQDVIQKYHDEVYKQFLYYQIFSKAEALARSTIQSDQISEKLNKLDCQITEIVLKAEKRSAPKRNVTRWSSDISNFSLAIKFYKVKAKYANDVNISIRLQYILDKMSDTFVTSHFGKEIQNQDPRQGIKIMKKKKQKHIMKSKHDREDHYYEIAKRSQKELPKDAFRQQMYINQCHRNIRASLGRGGFSALTTIDVPIIHSVDGTVEWSTVSDPNTIENHLINRNILHFGQAKMTDFASGPLADELGYLGTNEASMSLLNGKLPQAYSQVSETTQMIIEQLMEKKHSTLEYNVTFEDFCNAIRHWDEKTTTSPSGRHLGHYRALLMNFEERSIKTNTANNTSDSEPSKAICILKVYYNILIAAINSGTSLQRWQTSHTSMIQKVVGNSRIDKLRVIHIYEADYNLFLKLFWGRQLVYNSERNRRLNEGQYGSRPGKKCSDQVVKKIMVYEYSKVTRTPMASMDNDAKSCFDRIICCLAMLISMFYGLSKTIVEIHAKTLLNMKYFTKTALGPSSSSYSHTDTTPIFGTGQGSCASPSLWLHISSFLMDILDAHSFGFQAVSVTNQSTVKINNQGFVDDTSLMTNGGSSIEELLARLKSDAQTWSNLLYSSGGLLELSKCLYYIVDYTFDQTGNPVISTPEHDALTLHTNESPEEVRISLFQDNEAHKTLGCFRAINGNESTQYNKLMIIATEWARKISSRYFSRQEAWLVYHSYFMPKVLYSMHTTNFSKQQCDSIQSPVINAVLPHLGFNRHTSRDLIFAPAEFGGVGISDLYTELYTTRLETLTMHIRDESSELGRLFQINLGYIQLLIGRSTSYLTSTKVIKYIQDTWFSGLHEFMVAQELKMEIPSLWLPKPLRERDKVLMDDEDSSCCLRLQVINNWRLFYQINLLSDLVTADGTRICSIYLSYPQDDTTPKHPERFTTLLWPIQKRPSERSFCYWKQYILRVANADLQGRIRKPLGKWFPLTHDTDNIWKIYAHPSAGSFLFDPIEKNFTMYSPASTRRATGKYICTSTTTSLLPPGCSPTSGVITQNTITLLQIPKFTVITSPKTTFESFDVYLDSLQQWEQRLLSMWWSVDKPELLYFLQHESTLVLVSDGGCKTQKGSYGAVLGTSNKETKATVEGFVKGGYSPLTSFRCEAYGMLSSFLFFKHLCLFYKIKGLNRHIDYYCDGLSLLNRISHDRFRRLSNKAVLKEDFDLELQILQEIKELEKLGFKITISFVRGHQTISEQSSPQAVFNEVADNLASRNLHSHNTWLPFDLLPTMRVIITFNKVLLTGSIRQSIRKHVLFPGLYKETQKLIPTSKHLASNLWWEVQKKTLLRFARSDRYRIIKFNFNILHTKKMEHLYDKNISDTCPLCSIESESSTHLLLCNKLSAQRQKMLDQIHRTMNRSLKHNALNECIYVALGAFLNGNSIPEIQSFIDEPSEYLIEAYQQQTSIGWEQLCKGRWSSLWEPIFNHEIQATTTKRKLTAIKWASDIQFDIWSGFLDCWETRNSHIHGSVPRHQQNFRRQCIMKEINNYIQTHMADQQDIAISIFENKTLSWIVDWLRHQRGKNIEESHSNSVVSLH
jgi:hypothetical protein